MLAFARKMWIGKERQALLDLAYSRFIFYEEKLPKWIVCDEAKYLRPVIPLRGYEITGQKEKVKSASFRISKSQRAKFKRRKRKKSRMLKVRLKCKKSLCRNT